MSWIILAITAYFLLAVVEIIDKYILSSPMLKPLTYAFFVGLLTSAAFILWPFDFSFLAPTITLIALLGGASFFVAIYFLYSAIQEGEISRVISIIGGISPIIIFIFSYLFLKERLSVFSLASLLMLIGGSIILSFVKDEGRFKFGKRFFVFSVLAAFFVAISYFLSKAVFLKTSFLNGFIWVRMGTLLCSLLIFFIPSLRKSVISGSSGFSRRLTGLFIFNKGLSALSHIILYYAVMLGSATVISALQATEYVFVFILALGISYFIPRFLYEPFSLKILAQKITGVSLVSLGVVILFVGL